MHSEHTAQLVKRLNLRLTGVAAVAAVSVATNLALTTILFAARQTVLVPMLPAAVTLSNYGGVSADYLESAARDAAYLFLNRTPDNTAYFEQQLLRIADPATYQAVRASLSDNGRHVLNGHVSQTFIPNDWYTDAAKLYVEASGTLVSSNGTQEPASEQKIYAIRFVRHGSSLRLASFEEIGRDRSRGAKLAITPPPPLASKPLNPTGAP